VKSANSATLSTDLVSGAICLAIIATALRCNAAQRKATRGDAVPHRFVTKIPTRSTSHARPGGACAECGAFGANANHEGLVLCQHAAVPSALERLEAPFRLFECVLLPEASSWRRLRRFNDRSNADGDSQLHCKFQAFK
jgi:hypothetical protein